MSTLRSAARFVDQALTHMQIEWLGEKNSLIIFLFHTIFDDQQEEDSNVVHPGLGIQLEEFERFVEYYVTHGYTFVTPEQVLAGLPADGRYGLITFDDGYFNNQRVLPVMEKQDVPALFFISTNHVINNRAYWWDVIYRERKKQGRSDDEIDGEIDSYKSQRHDEIEPDIAKQFGLDALTPVGDLDRPMTPEELKEFAKHKLVHLGNHTSDHALLTNYDQVGVRDQIEQCQRDLERLTGETPKIVSYPNGNFDDSISRISQEVGLEMGITTRPEKNPLPLDCSGLNAMQLHRFMPDNNDPIVDQCKNIRSDIRLLRRLKSLGKSRPNTATQDVGKTGG